MYNVNHDVCHVRLTRFRRVPDLASDVGAFPSSYCRPRQSIQSTHIDLSPNNSNQQTPANRDHLNLVHLFYGHFVGLVEVRVAR